MSETLAKIIQWAFANSIEINVSSHKEDGMKELVEIRLTKNGKQKTFRAYDFNELDKRFLQKQIEILAFDLCLERLIL